MSKNSYSKVGGENVRLLQALIDEAPSYTKPTNSRNANILKSIINNTEYNEPPQSEIEELLIALKAKIGGEIEVNELTVTENGSYDAGLNKAYNPVNVELPLDSKEITANGTYNASDNNLAGFSQVRVNVEGYLLKDIPNTPTAIATFTDGANLPMPKLEVAIEPVQEGSGDPSPENIRPIIGWDEVNASVSGVNVWDEEWVIISNVLNSKNYIPVKPNTQYYMTPHQGRDYICFDSQFNVVRNWTWLSSLYPTFTTPSDCYYIKFRMTSDYGTTYNNDISINYPSTDTEYHAYNGHTYTIDLDGTRYGGKVDLVSGTLVVDRMKWFLEPNASQIVSVRINDCLISIPSDKTPIDWNVTINKCMCNKLKVSNYSEQHDNHVHFPNALMLALYLADEVGTTKQDWVDYLAQAQIEVSYIIATPITIQLTPTVVKSLDGVNNVSADSGDVRDGKYFAEL